MKIALYTRFMSLKNQGQGRVSLDVYNMLKSQGHDIIVRQCPYKGNIGYLFYCIIERFFSRTKADVHIALSSMDALYLPKDKSVVIIHDLIPLLSQFKVLTHYNNKPHNQIGSLAFFYYTLRHAIKFKRIICISSKTNNELLSVFKDLDKNKMVIIHNKINPMYTPQPRTMKKRPVLYTLSVLDHRKRTMELINWFKNSGLTGYDLVIGGAGSLYNEAKRAIKGHDNIKLLGKVPEDEMLARYKDCDIFLFPTMEEGFGMPIIEAVNCGRPVITLDDGVIPDEVKNCTIVSDWARLKRAIVYLINNPDDYDYTVKHYHDKARIFREYNEEKFLKCLNI